MTRCEPIFSLVMPYHAAPRMLARHGKEWTAIPRRLRDHIEAVVCDDASPGEPIYLPDPGEPLFTLLRIPPPHIRWSHRCATNVAASHARGQWLLITDIDHVVPVDTWNALDRYEAQGTLDPSRVYTFERVNTDYSPYKPHPDSWLIHRTMWAKIGGYDTRYRGHYGQNMPFKMRVRHHAGDTIQLDWPLLRFTREEISDASMPVEFGRKTPEDRHAVADMAMRFQAAGTFYQPGEIVPHVQVYP